MTRNCVTADALRILATWLTHARAERKLNQLRMEFENVENESEGDSEDESEREVEDESEGVLCGDTFQRLLDFFKFF